MLIRAHNVTLNVTGIKKITVDKSVKVSYKKAGLFKRTQVETVTWGVTLYYKDENGKDANFSWHGADERRLAEEVEKELLSQIKEVELENMSMALENAIRGGGNG